jgi:hypothetical protein
MRALAIDVGDEHVGRIGLERDAVVAVVDVDVVD